MGHQFVELLKGGESVATFKARLHNATQKSAEHLYCTFSGAFSRNMKHTIMETVEMLRLV